MASPVDIANMGLYRAGSSIRITSLTDSTEKTDAVRQAAFFWPLVRDQVLQSAPWGCARKCLALALDPDTTYPGYQYVYQYPDDCLQAVAVCDSGGLRGPSYWMSWWGCRLTSGFTAPKVPFQVGTSADGQRNVIMTDIAGAYLYYIFRQTVTNTYSPLLTDAMGWKMGVELGSAVNANAGRVTRCIQMYEPTLSRAMAQMMNEAQQDVATDSPSIQARAW